MRLKINLKAKNNFKVPFNYNHFLSAIVYNKIADLDLAQDLHDSNSYKFFNFSQLQITHKRILKNGILAKDGEMNFYLSSPNDLLIENIVNGFAGDMEIKFGKDKMKVEQLEVLKTPDF